MSRMQLCSTQLLHVFFSVHLPFHLNFVWVSFLYFGFGFFTQADVFYLFVTLHIYSLLYMWFFLVYWVEDVVSSHIVLSLLPNKVLPFFFRSKGTMSDISLGKLKFEYIIPCWMSCPINSNVCYAIFSEFSLPLVPACLRYEHNFKFDW